ncbi:MAG TPA: PQQ-dependent sugar dehydrogenase [Balneolaceae bacterium]|nr:PQQ-dependent sugar dehydrogenase [Balneolaceae bacterium]
MKLNKAFYLLSCCSLMLLAACSSKKIEETNNDIDFSGAESNLTLPDGFKAVVVAEDVGAARHITVAQNGDIYVSLRNKTNGGGVAALRDTDGDGKADVRKYFGDHADTGIQLHDGYLYASSPTAIYRYKMNGEDLVPQGEAEVLVKGFPEQRQHNEKAFVINDKDELFVNIGAPSNACQKKDRQKESPGMEPCPLLEEHAGIWKFSASQTGQTFSPEKRFATGLRNIVALDWNDNTEALYVVQHGRDQLFQNWPDYYSKEESAKIPAEAMYKVNENDNFGWPYSYYDQTKSAIMLAPEYGGNGKKTIDETDYAGKFEKPIISFPGHWAPNGLVFYDGKQFPEKYRGGAFIAFHGSWNRSPMPQQGYKVVFAPFKDGKPAGDYSEFANGFAGTSSPQPSSANHRPSGVAVGPDGSLYVADDAGGTIWRIVYSDE